MNNHKQRQTILKTGLLVIILAATVISYSKIFGLDFQMIFGDNLYVLNKKIQDFSFANIVKYFYSFHGGEYQPLTLLSFAVNYQIFGLNPTVYHVQSLLMHILNIILVFILINRLTKNTEITVIITLFFAIHPMNVEAVSWISGRQNLLYSLFFLASLIFYQRYNTDNHKKKFYYLSLLMFFISSLFMSLAITLPLVLFLFDYYGDRKFSKDTILEKVPFFIISIIFGIVALLAHESTDAEAITNMFSLGDRFFLVSFGLMSYIIMLIFPYRGFAQSAIHHYPDKVDGLLPVEFYIAPAVILIIFLIALLLKRYRKNLLFGFLFFLITISVVSQIIPIGKSIITERYVYIPYLGLFFIIAFIYNQLANKWKFRMVLKPLLIIILLALGISFAYKTFTRNRVWQDSITLFGNVARRYPDNPEGIFRKGVARYMVNDVRGAILDYNTAIIMNRQYADPYYWRGLGRFDLALPEPAIADFDILIQLKPEHYKAYVERGRIKITTDDYKGAINDCLQAINIKPDYYKAYKYLAIAYFKIGNFNDALEQINQSIELKADDGENYFYRGLIYQQLDKPEQACSDWKTASYYGYDRAAVLHEQNCK